VCNSGIGLVPVIDGKVHHFAARGLYNGLVLLGDRESGSYWNHITGLCVHGPLAGSQLSMFPLLYTSAGQAYKDYPNLGIALSKQKIFQRIMSFFSGVMMKSARGFIPPGFRKTMGEADTRYPRMETGLGVWTEALSRFYPKAELQAMGGSIKDNFGGREIIVSIDTDSGVPEAVYAKDTGAEAGIPMQLFTRWYGFSYTFPGCGIFIKN
jgi:hypothetical protein